MADIWVVEPGASGGVGATGMHIMRAAVASAGHRVTLVRNVRRRRGAGTQGDMFGGTEVGDSLPPGRPDAIYVSLLYVRQMLRLPQMFRWLGVPARASERSDNDPLVVFGGQAMIAPEPIAPMADIIAFGDGEITAPAIAGWLDDGGRGAALDRAEMAQGVGYYVPARQTPDDVVVRRVESSVIMPTPIAAGTAERRRSYLVEAARGCASKCAFCPIGWAGGTYREAAPEAVVEAAARVRAARVNVFAPDYASIRHAGDIERRLVERGCRNSGVDSRIDRALAEMEAGAAPRQFAFGIEGPSERLRRAVGKPLATDMIERTMARLQDHRCRWYVILGLPGETDEDITEFRDLVERVCERRSQSLDVTLTLLQPVPHTPLEGVDGHWPRRSWERAMGLREWAQSLVGEDRRMRVLFSQPKGKDRHDQDTAMQRADRRMADVLLDYPMSRWREGCEAEGIDVDRLLDPIEDASTTPWRHMRPGQSDAARAAGLRAYWRRLAA